MTNTLAYYGTELFTAVKSFMVLAHTPFLKMELTLGLGWKRLNVTNTLAYCGTEIFTAVNGLLVIFI
jgi:hypothetical protein